MLRNLQLCMLVIIILGCFWRCAPIQRVTSGNMSYFRTDSSQVQATIATIPPTVARINKGDVLAIVVSSLNNESNAILNFLTVNTLPVSNFSGGIGGGSQPLGFPVDSAGAITMPFVGRLIVDNLTLQEAELKIMRELEKSIKSPVVNVRFMNHKFSLLGEVNAPGTYNLIGDQTTIIDAIALAGDLTVFGKRDSVIVIRTIGDKRQVGLVNLTNRTVFTSPYFYLKNGDLIYVEPNKNKVLPEVPYQQTPPPSLFFQRAPLVLSLISIVTLFVTLFRK